MRKRHIIKILMLSPFYFTMSVSQRRDVVNALCRNSILLAYSIVA